MAEAFSEAGQTVQDVAKGAFDASLTFIKLPQGARISISISTTNIRVAKELCKLGGYVGLGIGGATLGVLLGYKVLKPLVVSAVNHAFGGDRDDQDTDDIRPGSLHVVIRCLTDERFLEIVDDCKTGRLKTRLKDEFSQVGIEVEGLKVEIENVEEVNKTKEGINKKRGVFPREITTEGKEAQSYLIAQHLDEARVWIQEKDISGLIEFLNSKLDEWKEVKIQLAVIGESGAGKSAFINAIRGLKDDDKGAAETGVLGTTTELRRYKHADNSNISYLDLPGTNTPNIQQTSEKSGLAECDVFLIISSTQFTPLELELANKLKSTGKAFFFIRTKIDTEMYNESRKQNFDENKSLKYIRKQLYETTKHFISNEKEIFLISNYDTNKWDFDRLIVAISEALFVLQREFLTNALGECFERKKVMAERGGREIAKMDSTNEDKEKHKKKESFLINISGRHRNWLTVGELYRFIEKPISNYVNEVVKAFHKKLCKDLFSFGKCRGQEDCNKKMNPYDLCESCKCWLTELEKFHRAASNPSWNTNCNSARWSDDHWEVAKFFMPAFGSNRDTVKDAKSTDLSSLLSVLEWMKDEAFLGSTRVDIALVRKLRSQVRNTWAHAPKLEFDDSEKSQSFSIANECLEDLEKRFPLKENRECKEHLENLEKNGVANIVESELRSLLFQHNLLDDIKEEIMQMRVERSSDKNTIGEHEQKLKNLEFALNECSQRMSDFESLKENIDKHFDNYQEQLKSFRAIPDDIHEIRNSIEQIRVELATKNERQQEQQKPTSSLPERVPTFTARKEEMKNVISLLNNEGKAVVSLHGGPGFGKTAIAIEVSHKLSQDHNITVIFSELATAITVDEMIRRLCLDVGINYEKDDPKPSLVLWLKNVESKVVFVLDDIDNQLEQNNRSSFDDLIRLLRKSGDCQMITTSRSSYEIPDLSEGVVVLEMDDKASMELLKNQSFNQNNEFLRILAKECGNIPLAMCIAASQVNDFDNSEEFLHHLQQEPLKTLERPESNQYVDRVINMSYDRLKEGQKEILVRLAAFDGSFDDEAASVVIEKKKIDAKPILKDLVRRSLLKKETKNRHSIHLLIKYFLRKQKQGENEIAEKARKQAKRANLLMVEYFLKLGHALTIKSYSKDGYKPSREALKQEAHNIQTVLNICCQPDETSLDIPDCLTQCEIYTTSGKFFSLFIRTIIPGSIVDKFLQKCAQLAKERKQYAIKINFDCLLADVERDKTIGRPDKDFTSKMEKIINEFETHHEDLKKDNSLCAYYYYLLGRYLSRKSESYKGMRNKGRLEMQMRARELLEKSLELTNKLTDTAVGMADKVFSLLHLGNAWKLNSTVENYFIQAEGYYEEATKLSRDNFGEHELTSYCYKTHGDLFLKIREYDMAEENYILAKEMREELGLNANEKHVSLLNNLGICLTKSERQNEAIEVLESARDMAEKLAENDEPNRCKSKVYTSLALAHDALERESEVAVRYAKRALEYQGIKYAIKRYEYEKLQELCKLE